MNQYCFFLAWDGMTPSEWAAWVQAVGSVLAILAAVGIALWQHHVAQRSRLLADVERRNTEEARARSLALGIHGTVSNLAFSLEKVAELPDDAKRSVTIGTAELVDAEALRHIAPLSWELGDASKPLQLLIFTLATFKGARETYADPRRTDEHGLALWMLQKCARSGSDEAKAALQQMTILFLRAADH